MKKTILHIGYPKAASTTLQNQLFMGLHRHGAINFLGRAWESGFYGSAKDKKEYKQLLNKVIKSDSPPSYNEIKNALIPSLSNNVPNVFSEGLFLTNETKGKTFVMPERMYNLFRNMADEIEILIVLRSQTTLIMSNYVQRYNKIRQKAFSSYLDRSINSNSEDGFKIFFFSPLIRKYADVFGKGNIHILFFEDLTDDRDRFVRDLSGILSVETSLVDKCLGDSRLNKTRTESGAHIVKKPDTASLRWKIGKLFNKVNSGTDEPSREKIPHITAEERELIFKTFKADNRRLAEEFSLDLERMRRYRYF